MEKIALGGSCYWCTEAIFQSLRGVLEVEQGWLSGEGEDHTPSEGVIVHFDPQIIGLTDLIRIHLHTHSSTSRHSMRNKYRSAVYAFSQDQWEDAVKALQILQREFDNPLITRVLEYRDFKASPETMRDYYYSRPEKPFCTNIIAPKLLRLLGQFGEKVDQEKVKRTITSASRSPGGALPDSPRL